MSNVTEHPGTSGRNVVNSILDDLTNQADEITVVERHTKATVRKPAERHTKATLKPAKKSSSKKSSKKSR
jgi:hypothetical protein